MLRFFVVVYNKKDPRSGPLRMRFYQNYAGSFFHKIYEAANKT